MVLNGNCYIPWTRNLKVLVQLENSIYRINTIELLNSFESSSFKGHTIFLTLLIFLQPFYLFVLGFVFYFCFYFFYNRTQNSLSKLAKERYWMIQTFEFFLNSAESLITDLLHKINFILDLAFAVSYRSVCQNEHKLQLKFQDKFYSQRSVRVQIEMYAILLAMSLILYFNIVLYCIKF